MKLTNIRRIPLFFCLLGLIAAVFYSCQKNDSKLMVVIVVDQMRPDHFSRFADLYDDGLARLIKNGAYFSNAHQDHSYTVTGAGHATLATGRFPSQHGIIGNEWFDREKNYKMYCCQDNASAILNAPDADSTDGRSPVNMRSTTIGEWLQNHQPGSRIFSAAIKDRAAIFSTGKINGGVYWFNKDTGNMISSEYYADSYPEWVSKFNEGDAAERYFEKGWQRLLPADQYLTYSREDSFGGEWNDYNSAFPHPFKTEKHPVADKNYYMEMPYTPFGDEHVFNFVHEMIVNEKIGQNGTTDMLFVGCSAADYIGHRYGPFSQESMDYFLRLDKYVGDLLRVLDKTVGEDNYYLAFSSDHGVMPLPEELQRRNIAGVRVEPGAFFVQMRGSIEAIEKRLSIQEPFVLSFSSGGLSLNYEVARRHGVKDADLNAAVAEEFKKYDCFTNAYIGSELSADATDPDEMRPLYQRSYFAGRSPDIIPQIKENYIIDGGGGTTHGSPYKYDTHVPMLFYGPGIRATTIDEKTRTVDFAPTLAEWLGIPVPNEIDGVSLYQKIH